MNTKLTDMRTNAHISMICIEYVLICVYSAEWHRKRISVMRNNNNNRRAHTQCRNGGIPDILNITKRATKTGRSLILRQFMRINVD